MSINREKIKILKDVPRELHRGTPMEELKRGLRILWRRSRPLRYHWLSRAS